MATGEMWLVGVDERALDLRDCGCGEPPYRRLICTRPSVKPAVIEVTFAHPGDKFCRLAFDYKSFAPLTYPEFAKRLGIEIEEDVG